MVEGVGEIVAVDPEEGGGKVWDREKIEELLDGISHVFLQV